MSNLNVIVDSSCDNFGLDTKTCAEKVPFSIKFGDTEFIDDNNIDIDELLLAMDKCKVVSRTACPSPEAWAKLFEGKNNIIAITVAGTISGSYQSAIIAKNMIQEKHPNTNIYIFNSMTAGPALELYSMKAFELAENGVDFNDICTELEAYKNTMHTLFAFCSFKNLVNNGRISKIAGLLATTMHIWGVGFASKEGSIELRDKIRGTQKVASGIIKMMKEDLFEKGSVIISHCKNLPLATEIKNKICEMWEYAKVTIVPAGGLCSYYAEREGVIIAYSCA